MTQEEIKKSCVTSDQAAAFLGVTVNRFRNMGVPAAGKVGRRAYYDPGALRKIAIANARYRKADLQESAGREKPQDIDGNRVQLELLNERRRLTAAQADAQEEKNRMMRHEIAPFDFVTFALASVGNALAAHLDSIPSLLIRQAGIEPRDAEKVRASAAGVANQIAALADSRWVSDRYDEYLKQSD